MLHLLLPLENLFLQQIFITYHLPGAVSGGRDMKVSRRDMAIFLELAAHKETTIKSGITRSYENITIWKMGC